MGENSGIEWTDHTFNPWWGCAKVSPACDFCYAERDAHRYQPEVNYWGVDAARREFGDGHWRQPLNWQRAAKAAGTHPRVFCASMADVFDKNAPTGARDRLWELIRQTPDLRWLLLTKRIGNAARMLPADWGAGYPNVSIGISVVTQAEADRDVPKLLELPARIRFLSIEPLLEAVDLYRGGFSLLRPLKPPQDYKGSGWPGKIDWVIVGGESGPQARPTHPAWIRTLRDQCIAEGVPFLFKQWGEWLGGEVYSKGDSGGFARHQDGTDMGHQGKRDHWWSGHTFDGIISTRVGKKNAGRMLDGRTWDELPNFEVGHD